MIMKQLRNGIIAVVGSFFLEKPITDIILPKISEYLHTHFGVTTFMLAMFIIYSILATITSIQQKRKLDSSLLENKDLKNKLETLKLKKINTDCPICKSRLIKTKKDDQDYSYKCNFCVVEYSKDQIE